MSYGKRKGNRRKANKELQRTYRYGKNPINKANCYHITNQAIKTGKLVRMPCEVCGKEKSEAHHDDYFEPLKVKWLCSLHHNHWHWQIEKRP